MRPRRQRNPSDVVMIAAVGQIFAAPARQRQVVGADEQAIDRFQRGDLLDILQRLLGLDHDPAFRPPVLGLDEMARRRQVVERLAAAEAARTQAAEIWRKPLPLGHGPGR